MASKISSFAWEKLLSKVEASGAAKNLNAIRGKANQITADAQKFGGAVPAIDFAAYSKRLKFTGQAVKDIEKMYTSTKLPSYTASVPAFESQKRAAMMETVKSTVAAANTDLSEIQKSLEEFEQFRVTKDTSYGELEKRFPHLAKEVETEVKEHRWCENIN